MVSFRERERVSQRSRLCTVFDLEESHPQDSYPGGQRRAGTHTHALSFSLFLFSFCVPQMHTLPSLSAHHCPLSFFFVPLSRRSPGVRADIIQSEGLKRKKECHSERTFLLFHFFHLCTSVVLDIWHQKILCQRVVRQRAMVSVQRCFHGSQMLDLLSLDEG